jgi:hypothetical protein
MHVALPLFRWANSNVGYRLSIEDFEIAFSVNDHSGVRALNSIFGIITKQNDQLEASAVHGIRNHQGAACAAQGNSVRQQRTRGRWPIFATG